MCIFGDMVSNHVVKSLTVTLTALTLIWSPIIKAQTNEFAFRNDTTVITTNSEKIGSESVVNPVGLYPIILPLGFDNTYKYGFVPKLTLKAIDNNIRPYKPITLPTTAMILLKVATLLLPYNESFAYGEVPMLNSSFVHIKAIVPSGAPYELMYSPEMFPQRVKTEYDILSGTYIRKIVSFDEFQKNMSNRMLLMNDYAPVPKMAVTPVERMMKEH